MEKWEAEHLRRNLSTLVEQSKFTPEFFSEIAHVLNENDNAELAKELRLKGEKQHSKLFYRISQRKVGMYAALTKAFLNTNQIKPFQVLLEGFLQQGIKNVFEICRIDEQEERLLEALKGFGEKEKQFVVSFRGQELTLEDTVKLTKRRKQLVSSLEVPEHKRRRRGGVETPTNFWKQKGTGRNTRLDQFSGKCKELLSTSFPELENLKYPVSSLVAESSKDSDTALSQKIQIIKFLSLKNTELLNERLPNGTPPLLQPNVHVKLLECLVNYGADVNVVNNDMSVLHKLGESEISPQNYHDMVLLLLANGFTLINKPDPKLQTPFHAAVEKVEVLEKTIQLLKLSGANINAVDGNGDSVLFYAIKAHRSTATIEALLAAGAFLKHKNFNDENVLHICAKYGNQKTLEHFLLSSPEIGSDELNAENKEGLTSFIQGLMHSNPLNLFLIKLMEEKGLKINKYLASDGIKALLSNKHVKALQQNAETVQVFDYLIERGGRLTYQPTQLLENVDNLTNDFFQHCFQPHNVQISYNWWGKSKYCSGSIQSFKFTNDTADKIESLVCNHSNDMILDHLRSNLTTELACKWLYASVMGNHINLLKLMIELDVHTKLFDFELESLVVLAVKYADTQVIDLIIPIYEKHTKKRVQDLELEFQHNSIEHTTFLLIFHIAALRGSYSVLCHLLNKYCSKTIQTELLFCDLLTHCLLDTHVLRADLVNERIRIIETLMQLHPTLIKDAGEDVFSPLLTPNIHIDLILYLITLGVNVHATREDDGCNVLHISTQYLTPQEYDKLVRLLYSRGESTIFHSRNNNNSTPLHWAANYLEVLDSTLEIFSLVGVDFNAKDKVGSTPLAYAALNHRSLRLLGKLERSNGSINEKGEFDRTVLHCAAQKGYLIGVEYFIKAGCEVNAKDCLESTPLHLALAFAEVNIHEIVQLLVHHGADVNAIDTDNDTPLSLALGRKKEGDIGNRTVAFLKKVGAK